MFEQIKAAPRDPILGLTESFREDPNPKKINLSVGVYQDGSGKTPILDSIHRAGKLVLERMKSKSQAGPPRRTRPVELVPSALPPISSISKCPKPASGSHNRHGPIIRKS